MKAKKQQLPVSFFFSGDKRLPPEGRSSIFSSPLTCNGQPVQLRVLDVLSTVRLAGDIIPEADGCKRDETEIQRLQEVPVLLQAGEDPRGDDEEQQGHEDAEAGGVYGSQLRFRHGPSTVEVGHRTAAHQDHDPLHHDGEEEEGDGDATEGVEDAEGLPFIREGNGVAITWKQKPNTQQAVNYRKV